MNPPSVPGGTEDGGLAQPLLALVLGGQHDGVPLRVLAPAEGVRVVVLNVQLLWDPIPDMNKGIAMYIKKLFPSPINYYTQKIVDIYQETVLIWG